MVVDRQNQSSESQKEKWAGSLGASKLDIDYGMRWSNFVTHGRGKLRVIKYFSWMLLPKAIIIINRLVDFNF